MKLFFKTLFVLLLLGFPCLYSQTDSFDIYPFLSKDHNFIQYHNISSLETFISAWNQMESRKLVVVHVGDSHLQNDAFPGRIRKNLQEIYGYGGKGLLFPFSAANTYSNHSYQTHHTGEWEYAKNIHRNPKLSIGITGMAVKTILPNSSLRFSFKNPEPNHYQILKVFYKLKNQNSYLQVEVDGYPLEPKLEPHKFSFATIPLPPIQESISLSFKIKEEEDSVLYFYGMSLESTQEKGIIWHNCGVDGAKFQSILKSKYFMKQLKSLQPDLVVLDLGTNEYAVGDSINPNAEDELITLIERIRKSLPNISIILNSTQDMSYKGKHLSSGRPFFQLIKKIAKQTNSAFYDFYSVAGGNHSIELWYQNNLAKKDLIHLTNDGYSLKGDLYSTALINTMERIQADPKSSLLIRSAHH